MCKSTVLVSFIGDPYIAISFRKNYEKWRDNIDEIIVGISAADAWMTEFISSLWEKDSKAKIVAYNEPMSHGNVFDTIYKMATGKVIITLDSDNYIIKPEIVSEYIDQVLSGEAQVIGSTGLHCNEPPMVEKCVQDYGFVRINPFMSFWDKSLIDSTGPVTFNSVVMNYDKKTGVLSKEGNNPIRFDTMSWMTYKIFFGNKIKMTKIPTWEKGGWVHAFATSIGVKRMFFNKKIGRVFDGFNDKPAPEFRPNLEWLTWMFMFHNEYKEFFPFEEYNTMYGECLLEKCDDSKILKETVLANIPVIKEKHGFDRLG
jgi:glycosyltransferase involved in cell wall biosynthesis